MKLTLDNLHLYCEEEGNCLIWRQGTNSTGYPQAHLGTRGMMVRRYVFTQLMGKQINPGWVVSSRCGNKLCISPACLTQKSIAKVVSDSYKSGARDSIVEKVKRRENCIRLHGCKIDMQKAREIRLSTDPLKEIAARYGISVSMVKRIRANRAWIEATNNSVFAWRPAA